MHKEIIIDGKKIVYRSFGKGKPVVLIHGFGEDGEVWRAPSNSPDGVEPASAQRTIIEDASLTDTFHFIIPDLPGSGKSELTEDMSMEGMAEVIKQILIAESSEVPLSGGFRGACLIGHSMGGYITLAFAEKYPELLSAFGLFHSSAYADTDEKKATRKKGIEFIKEHGAFEFLKTATPNLYAPITKEQRPELIEEQIAGLSNFSAPALVNYYEAMMQRPDRTEVLKQSKVPVLFIMGKYDNAVPMNDTLAQTHLPGKSYIHILQSSGHMGMQEEPQKSNQVMKVFLLST